MATPNLELESCRLDSWEDLAMAMSALVRPMYISASMYTAFMGGATNNNTLEMLLKNAEKWLYDHSFEASEDDRFGALFVLIKMVELQWPDKIGSLVVEFLRVQYDVAKRLGKVPNFSMKKPEESAMSDLTNLLDGGTPQCPQLQQAPAASSSDGSLDLATDSSSSSCSSSSDCSVCDSIDYGPYRFADATRKSSEGALYIINPKPQHNPQCIRQPGPNVNRVLDGQVLPHKVNFLIEKWNDWTSGASDALSRFEKYASQLAAETNATTNGALTTEIAVAIGAPDLELSKVPLMLKKVSEMLSELVIDIFPYKADETFVTILMTRFIEAHPYISTVYECYLERYLGSDESGIHERRFPFALDHLIWEIQEQQRAWLTTLKLEAVDIERKILKNFETEIRDYDTSTSVDPQKRRNLSDQRGKSKKTQRLMFLGHWDYWQVRDNVEKWYIKMYKAMALHLEHKKNPKKVGEGKKARAQQLKDIREGTNSSPETSEGRKSKRAQRRSESRKKNPLAKPANKRRRRQDFAPTGLQEQLEGAQDADEQNT